MREILFRGKRIDGLWVEGAGITVRESDANILSELGGSYGLKWCQVYPETVGQYTGLTDKNGKKIFEGDMFQIEDDIIAVVIFKEGCFRLELRGFPGTWTESGFDECGGEYGVIECDPIDWYRIREMEVIGKIHDNPELLEVSHE